jgi:hypothetical protein
MDIHGLRRYLVERSLASYEQFVMDNLAMK